MLHPSAGLFFLWRGILLETFSGGAVWKSFASADRLYHSPSIPGKMPETVPVPEILSEVVELAAMNMSMHTGKFTHKHRNSHSLISRLSMTKLIPSIHRKAYPLQGTGEIRSF